MQVNALNFSGITKRQNSINRGMQLAEEQSRLLRSSLDKIKKAKEELPRFAREDSDIRRFKHVGNVEILLNEATRNINQVLGKTNLYYHA